MTEDYYYYLDKLGIIPWTLKKSEPTTSSVKYTSNQDNWENIQTCVKNCTACDLHKTRTQTVFGTGNREARLMFIGEAPGAEEDKQGKPFVGRAGLLLTEMLRSIGFSREDVYIANILKCRPPHNRNPEALEVERCTPFLKQQIELIKPALLVALGRVASHFLLNTSASLSSMRGKSFEFNHIPLRVMYHPAYLLRNPIDKAKAYEDLKAIRSFYDAIPAD